MVRPWTRRQVGPSDQLAMEQLGISAIINCCEDSDLVSAAIESVLSQDYQDVDCVLLETGFPDVAKQLRQRYGKRIRLASENTPLESFADIVARLDPSDRWLKGTAQIAASFLQSNRDVDVIHGCVLRMNLGNIVRIDPTPTWQFRDSMLDGQAHLNRSATMVRRRVWDDARWLAIDWGDASLWTSAFLSGARFAAVPLLLASSGPTHSSASLGSPGPILGRMTSVISDKRVPRDLLPLRRKAMGQAHLRAVRQVKVQTWGEQLTLLSLLARAIMYSPSSVRHAGLNWGRLLFSFPAMRFITSRPIAPFAYRASKVAALIAMPVAAVRDWVYHRWDYLSARLTYLFARYANRIDWFPKTWLQLILWRWNRVHTLARVWKAETVMFGAMSLILPLMLVVNRSSFEVLQTLALFLLAGFSCAIWYELHRNRLQIESIPTDLAPGTLLDLAQFTALNNGTVSLEDGSLVSITTGDSPWTYAAHLELDAKLATLDPPKGYLRARMRVKGQAVGLGVLDDGGQFVVRRSVEESSDFEDIYLPTNFRQARYLVVESWDSSGKSCVTIQELRVF